jgi:hypothetical protein
MTSHPLAQLDTYPTEPPGPEDRAKIVRVKDRHEPGTGRRDRQKRDGRGNFNWGDQVDAELAARDEELAEPDGEEDSADIPASAPEHFKLASEVIDDEDDEAPPKPAKRVVKVRPDLAALVDPAREDVQIVAEDVPYTIGPRPVPEKKPKKRVRPAAAPAPNEEEDKSDEGATGGEKAGKKQKRDRAFGGVQHNRVRPGPQVQVMRVPQPRGPP